jgi:hypothetical protein
VYGLPKPSLLGILGQAAAAGQAVSATTRRRRLYFAGRIGHKLLRT